MGPVGPNQTGTQSSFCAGRLLVLAPVLAAVLIAGLVGVVYEPLLTTATAPPDVYPWGSGTWGHLFKASYLYDHAAGSDFSPALMPWWCAGMEPFRRWAPLPYYLLGGLRYVGGNIFVAGAWLIPLCAFLGGLSWLAFSRRLGWLGACAAGLCWTVWPDHVRVALSEGDLPRVAATAFLPLLFAAFLDSLDRRRWPWSGLGFVIVLNLIVLSHAVVAVGACTVLVLFSLCYWWFSGARRRDVLRGLALIVLALLCSAWWLIPSLLGGTAAAGPEAAGGAVDLFAPSISLHPLLRLHNPEAFYLGISSVISHSAGGLEGERPRGKGFLRLRSSHGRPDLPGGTTALVRPPGRSASRATPLRELPPGGCVPGGSPSPAGTSAALARSALCGGDRRSRRDPVRSNSGPSLSGETSPGAVHCRSRPRRRLGIGRPRPGRRRRRARIRAGLAGGGPRSRPPRLRAVFRPLPIRRPRTGLRLGLAGGGRGT